MKTAPMVQLVQMKDSAIAKKILRDHNATVVKTVSLVSLPVNHVDVIMMVAYTIIATRQQVIAFVFQKSKEISVTNVKLIILTFQPVNSVAVMEEEARILYVMLLMVIVTVLSMSPGKNVTNVNLDTLIFRIAKVSINIMMVTKIISTVIHRL